MSRGIDSVSVWIDVLRQLAFTLIGVVGMTILLVRYWQTGEMSLPAFGAFSGMLGVNAIGMVKG